MKQNDIFIAGESKPWQEIGAGVRRRVLGYDSSLMMMCVRFAKNSVGSLHSHPHRQVTYIEKGSFEVQVGSEKTVLRSGDSFFVPPDTEHGVIALEEGTLIDVFAPAREDILSTQA